MDEVFISFYYWKLFSWKKLHVLELLQQVTANLFQVSGLKQQKCIFSTVLEAPSLKFQISLFPGAVGEKLFLTFSSSWQKCAILCLLLHHTSASVVRVPPPPPFRSLIRSLLQYLRFIWIIQDYLFSRKSFKKKTLTPIKGTFRGFGHYTWMSLGGNFSAYHRWMHHNSLIYSPVTGQLVYFHFLATTNTNIHE